MQLFGLARALPRGAARRAVGATMTLGLAAVGLSGATSAVPDAILEPRMDLVSIETPLTRIPAETRAMATAKLQGTLGASTGDGGAAGALVTAEQVFRISGADRYATAVANSWLMPWGDIDGDGTLGNVEFPDGSVWTERPAPVVFVATGSNYRDALAAVAVAGVRGGPLLLTQTASLPTIVADEITRLHPTKIVVAGDQNAVSPAVYAELRAIQTDIRRDAGATPYETSRVLSERGFAGKEWYTGGAFIATGANFADALAASAAGATYGKPVILVPGTNSSLDAETEALLGRLAVDRVSIVGNTNAVSAGIESDLESLLGPAAVDRLGGAGKYNAAVAVNNAYFGRDHVENGYVPSGANIVSGDAFPDALSAAAIAGKYGEPLYTSSAGCLPANALTSIRSLEIQTVWIYGGESALSPAVESLTTC